MQINICLGDKPHIVLYCNIHNNNIHDNNIDNNNIHNDNKNGSSAKTVTAFLAQFSTLSAIEAAANQNRRVSFMRLLADSLKSISNAGEEIAVDVKGALISDLHPDNMGLFWSYDGSLTTPTYPEVRDFAVDCCN